MNERQRHVLVGIYRDREFYANQGRPTGRMDSQFATLWCRIQDCQKGLVQCNPGIWLGVAMTASLYVMVGRTYKQLEAQGLLRRHANGYDSLRTTHLELTPAGEAAACELSKRVPCQLDGDFVQLD